MPNYNLRKYDQETGAITPQWGFYNSRSKLQIFGGGFGNGKTTATVAKALRLIKDYPGSNGLIARATYPKLNDTIRKEFLSWCPPDWIKRRPTQEDNTCYMTNGTVVNFRYIAQRGKQAIDGSTTSNLLSATYDWIIVDQIEDPEISHKDLLDLFGRLRGSTSYRPEDPRDLDTTMPLTGPRWIILTANPSQNWFYKEIIQPFQIYVRHGILSEKLLVDQATKLPILELFEGSTYTNRDNLAPDYLVGLEASYKGQMRERYLMGKWAAFEGLVHPEFSNERNVITRNQALTHLEDCLRRHVAVRIIEGYDYGLAAPSCYGIGFVDDAGRVILLDGFYRPEFSYTLQPPEIFKMRQQYFPTISAEEPIEADPSIFRRTVIAGNKDTGTRLSDIFIDQFDLQMRPAANEITNGISKVNNYIAGIHDAPHIVTQTRPGPLLYVCQEVEWFFDEVYSYYWKKNPQGNRIDEPLDNNDHAMNMVKYMLSHLPDPSEIIVPSKVLPPSWMFWNERELERV